MIEIVIYIFCAIGMSYGAYQEGKKAGATKALDLLYQEKIICYSSEGHIKPNPFFDHGPWVDPEEKS